jgi:hypothetical protein
MLEVTRNLDNVRTLIALDEATADHLLVPFYLADLSSPAERTALTYHLLTYGAPGSRRRSLEEPPILSWPV